MIEIELREYQSDLISDVKSVFRTGKRRVCAVLGCGGGKSVIAAHIAKSATDKNNRVLFLVHRKELCEQISDTFSLCNVDRIICTVGMVQTVANRINKIPAPSLIIVDEFHHSPSKTYQTIFDAFPDALILGFTATPIRLSTGGLGDVCDELVMSVSTKWLIENGYLAPYKYYSVPVADVSSVKVSRGEYDAKQLAEVMESKFIYGETVRNYRLIADGKKTIVYCASVESARQTAEEFRQNGYTAESLDGGSDKAWRSLTMRRFRDNEIQILTNCELFGEGLDVPDVECVILLRKTKSLTLYIQQSMRAMRYKPDKVAIIIDHVGNIYEHDYPDADREWALEPKKRKSKETEVMVKACPNCFAVMPLQARVCTECGCEFKAEERGEKPIVEMQLQEITALNILKAKPYGYYKRIKSWDDMVKFADAKDNIKKKSWWCVYKSLELGIQIPPKYSKMESMARRNIEREAQQ